MREASKTNVVRGSSFETRYLQGRVIDIGCGQDLVSPAAEPFDLVHGDAQQITKYRPVCAYDTVHSSHCLEHMADPLSALGQWWALVKPGGYLIVVVPDEDLYEQGYWPSRFNDDHKCTFNLDKQTSWSPVSHNIREITNALPDVETIEIERQDHSYNYTLMSQNNGRTDKKPVVPLKLVSQCVRAVLKPFPSLRQKATWAIQDHYFHNHGVPIDQTARQALAQIQVIAKKDLSAN
mgnify:FL=1